MMIEQMTITLYQMIIEDKYNLFDFEYPFFDESKRKDFEQQFIDYFLFYEIGQPTPQHFKHVLKSRLNLIMPYWNKILEADQLKLRILDNYDVKEISTRTVKNNGKVESMGSGKDLTSSNPMTKQDLNNIDFADSIAKTENDNKTLSDGTTTETYEYQKTGNIGVQTDSDGIVSYWKGLRKIYLEIFQELEVIFMGVM